ncbi:hypothetical protein F4823DRAFT_564025 [Ustulina deusta]|nr:hypothetical protein F4823DRAFT_564025 [Ustulina deusta]
MGPALAFQPGYNATKANDTFAIWNATNLAGTDGSVGPYHPEVPSIAHNDTSCSLYIMKFAAIGLLPSIAGSLIDGTQDESTGTLSPMQAHECALWLCIYASKPTRAHTDIHSPGLLRPLVVTDFPLGGFRPPENLIQYGDSHVVADWDSPSLCRSGGPPNTVNVNPLQEACRHRGDLQSWTTNLARELTNNIAVLTSAPETDQYDGNGYSPQTYFEIR